MPYAVALSLPHYADVFNDVAACHARDCPLSTLFASYADAIAAVAAYYALMVAAAGMPLRHAVSLMMPLIAFAADVFHAFLR